MTGEELRQSILQMAMQGELVEQDYEHDEPAWKLLERIKEEKKRLIEEGKIKKEKELSPVTEDEKPFDIPDNWEWARLGDVWQIVMGQSPKGDSVSELVEGTEFHQGTKQFGERFLNISKVNTNEPKKIAPVDSVLLSVRAPVGKTNITDRKICIGRGLSAIFPYISSDKTEDFIYNWLLTQEESFQKQSTGTTFKAIALDIIRNQPVALPPLNEQKRIVEKLEELEPFIQQYTELEEKLTKLNQEFPQKLMDSILNEAMQGNLTEQDYEHDEPAWKLVQRIKPINKKIQEPVKEEEKSFDIPDNWEWTRLGRILNKLTDGTHSRPSYVSEGIPFLSVKDMSNGRLSFEGCKFISPKEHSELYKRCNPEFGDILLTKVGTTGIPVPVDTNREFSLFVSVALLKLPENEIFNKYLIEAIKSPVVQTQARENTRGVGNKNWVLRDIANTVLPLPPLNEQQRIVEKIESIKPLIESLKELNA